MDVARIRRRGSTRTREKSSTFIRTTGTSRPTSALQPAAAEASGARGAAGPAIVDVTMRFIEGQQYRINRITFVGNTTTHDNVIRRELRIYENNVFNTEGLKSSVRRLNQLGYFK